MKIFKGLEHAWRRRWVRLLAAILARRGRGGGGTWAPERARVLFLRPDRVGDMIVSTGIFRAIATAHQGLTLDVLASSRNARVLDAFPYVGTVHVLDRRDAGSVVRLVRRLRAARYDAVIDCMPTAPSVTTLMLMIASGARDRIGVARAGLGDALSIPVPPRTDSDHIIDHLAVLATPFGVSPAEADVTPELALTPDERGWAEARWAEAGAPAGDAGRRVRLLVNVSAGKAARRWPAASFVEVMRAVRAESPAPVVIVMGTPDETARIAEVAAAAGGMPLPDAGLRQAFALVAAADAVLTPDTSIAHAASAFGTPAVDLLLRGGAVGWGLYGTAGHNLESPSGILADLPPGPVCDAVLALVRQGARHPAVRRRA